VDLEGKRAAWEGIVKIPFVDEVSLYCVCASPTLDEVSLYCVCASPPLDEVSLYIGCALDVHWTR